MWNATYEQPNVCYNDHIQYDGLGGKRGKHRMQILQRLYATTTTLRGIVLTERGSADIAIPTHFEVGDVTIKKDAADFTNIGTLPTTGTGGLVEAELSALELTCQSLILKFIDQSSPKLWEDETILIDTYGNVDSQHPYLDVAISSRAASGIVNQTTNAHVVSIGSVVTSDFTSLNSFKARDTQPLVRKR